jgi:hypothetical protein
MEYKNIKNYYELSPLSHFYDFGLTQKDIKLSILDSFSPYFVNQDNLEKYAMSDLTTNWLAYLSVYKEYPDSLVLIDKILSLFNEAKEKNLNATIEAYVQWMPEITQSISRFWSLHNNQKKLDNLCLEDFVEESLYMIGKTIEGLSKSFINLLFHLNRIKRNKPYSFSEISKKDLGVIIDELINTTELTELLIIQPHEIRLNQWRNIAYHHNSKIINNELIFSYTKNSNICEFKTSREEVSKILKRILLTFKLLRISETIFGFDNLEKVHVEIEKIDKNLISVREDARLLNFYSGIESQGFKIIELTTSEKLSTLKLQDLEPYGQFDKRAIYSSQFLYNLWAFTESNKLVIDYHLFNGDLFFTSEIDDKSFIESNEDTSIVELLQNVKFIPHVIDYQNSVPIDIIDFPSNLKDKESSYLSQRGEKISLKEFANQFSLSVFCNFLVLKSEGFDEEKIKINVGRDGSLVIGEKDNKPMIFNIPSIIESKILQKFIIKLIHLTIELYSKGKLKYEIVETAKENNYFYFKKSQIRDRLMVTMNDV